MKCAAHFALGILLGIAVVVVAPCAGAQEPVSAPADTAAKLTGNITGFYYAMRDQPDFGVGVASLDRDALHLEARYNYEARNAGSAFAGWKFAGGEGLSYEITPIIGFTFGQLHAIVPGAEASIAWRRFDAYVEAEYVGDQQDHAASYVYAWSELGWSPVDGLRLGLVGQRSRVIHSDRDLQRGLFAQLSFGPATLSFYAFNPDLGSRYAIVSLGMDF